jgi:hypothetical protein
MLTFAEALAQESVRISAGWEPLWGYRAGSDYLTPLTALTDLFPHEQRHVVIFEELVTSPDVVLERLQRDLGLAFDGSSIRLNQVNTSGTPRSGRLYRAMSATTSNQLRVKALLPRQLVDAVRSMRNRLLVQHREVDEDVDELVEAMRPMVSALAELGHPVLDFWDDYRQ